MSTHTHSYAFISGKNKALSLAELMCVLKKEQLHPDISSITKEAIIIKVAKVLNEPQKLLNRLGSITKIVSIVGEIEKSDTAIVRTAKEHIGNNHKDSKYLFGISIYTSQKLSPAKVSSLGLTVKKELKDEAIRTRHICSRKDAYLSAAEVSGNKVLDKGADLVFISSGNIFLFGVTKAVQDFKAYALRDYEKPERDAKSGMLPPKLAQIMVNLATTQSVSDIEKPREPNMETSDGVIVYDPFCGTGTILTEALLLGYTAIGSDISEKAVRQAKINIATIQEQFALEKKSPDQMVRVHDATKPFSLNATYQIKPNATIVIASELYLGPPLTTPLYKKHAEKLVQDVEKLYGAFLMNVSASSNIHMLVLAAPVYKLASSWHHTNILDLAQNIGYTIKDPFEEMSLDPYLIPEYDASRKTIRYSRPDQVVIREIIILKK